MINIESFLVIVIVYNLLQHSILTTKEKQIKNINKCIDSIF